LYKLSAEQGYSRAQSNLGSCYYFGYGGLEQNYAEAVRLYKLAAEQNDPVAQSNLGVCYEDGLGVEQNIEEAIRLYKLAAEQGDEGSIARLEEMKKNQAEY
jgi:hypothetical protein